jgi:hypothetical protein
MKHIQYQSSGIFWMVIFALLLLNPLTISCKKPDAEKPSQTDTTSTTQTFGFITRSADKLMNGNQEFRFIGMDTPSIMVIEDYAWGASGWHRIDEFELRDVFKTIQQMGGTVTRTYTFSIQGGVPTTNQKTHIYGPGNYDEDMFKDLDLVLKLANEYKIRLIIPFIDNWNWVGGTSIFASFCGKTQADFCTDETVKSNFKAFINYVLNRTNTLTGIKYKDDPAILAWETGNELGPENAQNNVDLLDKWTTEITAYIKSIDKNHLVQDGKDCYRYGISDSQLNDPNTDIITDHYYWGDYVAACQKSRNLCKGKKVFYVGEFNSADPAVNENLLGTVLSNGTSGALLWSLRFHSKSGGFYYHEDPTVSSTPCFRWPGFASASATSEATKMAQIKTYAYAIQKLNEPKLSVPDAPYFIPESKPNQLRWQGSTGAQFYVLERATGTSGPWTIIDNHAMEDAIPYSPYVDGSAISGISYYYRITARNSTGASSVSNVIGPVSF